MSRFLVTGGAGFIGSNIVETLVRKKHFVRVMDNFTSGKIENLANVINKIDLIKADIRSKEACIKATKGIDFVLHQAALRSVPKSIKSPEEYNEVNIGGTLNMLKGSLKNKIKRFVLASSSSIYGDIDRFPQKESFLPRLISPYALSKLTGEYYCRIFSQIHGVSTVCLRYFNVFGPRQALDDEYAVVIPKFITCMLDDLPPPIYDTGRQSRDFTFVSNVVQANILAATKKFNFKGEAINIAGGKDYSILALVKILNEILGKDIKPVFLPKRPGDVFKTRADLSQAKKLLGLVPIISFIEGLRLTMEYFKEVDK